MNNIALVKNEVAKHQQSIAPKFIDKLPFIKKMKESLTSMVRSTPIFFLQLVFLAIWIFLFFYVRYLYKRRYSIVILLLFLLAACFGSMLVVKYNMQYRKYGIVVKKNAVLRSGPSDTFQVLLSLPEGSEGKIRKRSGEYYKVKIYNYIGWISRNDFKKI